MHWYTYRLSGLPAQAVNKAIRARLPRTLSAGRASMLCCVLTAKCENPCLTAVLLASCLHSSACLLLTQSQLQHGLYSCTRLEPGKSERMLPDAWAGLHWRTVSTTTTRQLLIAIWLTQCSSAASCFRRPELCTWLDIPGYHVFSCIVTCCVSCIGVSKETFLRHLLRRTVPKSPQQDPPGLQLKPGRSIVFIMV